MTMTRAVTQAPVPNASKKARIPHLIVMMTMIEAGHDVEQRTDRQNGRHRPVAPIIMATIAADRQGQVELAQPMMIQAVTQAQAPNDRNAKPQSNNGRIVTTEHHRPGRQAQPKIRGRKKQGRKNLAQRVKRQISMETYRNPTSDKRSKGAKQ
jgi:hypothetical protein